MALSGIQIRPDSNDDEVNRFRELALRYQDFGSQAGVAITPFRDPVLPLFRAKTPIQRQKILESLKHCVRICERAQAQGDSMRDSPALVWSALKEFGLRPCSDIFAHMSERCVIEVHSPEGVQIFRNFSFFEFCSYSIEELYCGEWNTLFDRDQTYTDQCIEFLKKVYSGEIRKTVPFNIAPHPLRETFSQARYEIELALLWGAPLFAEGTSQPAATLEVEAVRLLNSHALVRDFTPARERVRPLL